MSSITGIEGLDPTLEIIKYTKKSPSQIKSRLFVDGFN